jgi:hypothetical protein
VALFYWQVPQKLNGRGHTVEGPLRAASRRKPDRRPSRGGWSADGADHSAGSDGESFTIIALAAVVLDATRQPPAPVLCDRWPQRRLVALSLVFSPHRRSPESSPRSPEPGRPGALGRRSRAIRLEAAGGRRLSAELQARRVAEGAPARWVGVHASVLRLCSGSLALNHLRGNSSGFSAFSGG